MIGKIILCDNINSAYQLTESMYDEQCNRLGNKQPKEERITKYLLGVEENILTGQFGLHLPQDYIQTVDKKYLSNVQIKTPLWIDEKFINGEPFFAIGVGPFGFENVNPTENRKILEGNFSKSIIASLYVFAKMHLIRLWCKLWFGSLSLSALNSLHLKLQHRLLKQAGYLRKRYQL